MFFDMPRPQYVIPDALQSDLAWAVTSSASHVQRCAIILERTAKPANKTLKWIYTNPGADTGSLGELNADPEFHQGLGERWEAALKRSGIDIEAGEKSSRDVVNAVIESLRGVRPQKATGHPVVPTTYHLSLMQNLRGAMGVANPPNLAKAFEVCYALGGNKPTRGVANQWKAAIEIDEAQDVLGRLDRAIKDLLSPLIAEEGSAAKSDLTGVQASPAWLDKYHEYSPFHWFRSTWDRLMQASWRRAVPPRRWSDWTTCVLRTALGACYIWEARFYRELVSGLLDDKLDAVTIEKKAICQEPEILTWKSNGGVHERDVLSLIKETVRVGLNAKEVVDGDLEIEFPGIDGNSRDGLVDWIRESREIVRENSQDIARRLAAPERAKHNQTREAIRYALLCRQPLGKHADHYGLLVNRGTRYLLVEPSPEWPVVVASLACEEPGESTRLLEVMKGLRQLGMKPAYDTLIRTLELAGLCQASHDADEAIEVYPAF